MLSVGMESCSSTCSGRIWSLLVGIWPCLDEGVLAISTCTCSSAFLGCLTGMCGMVTLELYFGGDWGATWGDFLSLLLCGLARGCSGYG